jgi:hypothetical protein
MHGDDQHTHDLREVSDAASDHDLDMLGRRVDGVEGDVRNLDKWTESADRRMTDTEREVHSLSVAVRQLGNELEAEKALNAAMRAGHTTIPVIVRSLRRLAADPHTDLHLAAALSVLAATIEKEAT